MAYFPHLVRNYGRALKVSQCLHILKWLQFLYNIIKNMYNDSKLCVRLQTKKKEIIWINCV